VKKQSTKCQEACDTPHWSKEPNFIATSSMRRHYVIGSLSEKTQIISFLVGKYTRLYLKQFEDIKNDVVVIDDYCNLRGMREYLLKYLPEGVYYDTNHYEDLDICRGCPECYKADKCLACKHYVGQELVFDLDPKTYIVQSTAT